MLFLETETEETENDLQVRMSLKPVNFNYILK